MSAGRPFNFDRPFIAQRAIAMGDRSFAPGDIVPWRDLGLSRRKVWSLWGNREIGHEGAASTAPPDATPPQLDLAAPAASTRTTPRRRGS